MSEEIVITGSALITAAGGIEETIAALDAGRSLLRHHDGEPFPCARVDSQSLVWPPEPWWLDREKYAGIVSRLAIAVTDQALRDAGWAPADTDRGATVLVGRVDESDRQRRLEIALPTDDARPQTRRFYDDLEDFAPLRALVSTAAQMVAARTGFSGSTAGVGWPSFDGLAGLQLASDLIASGEVEAVMLVGVDQQLPPEQISAYCAHEPLATRIGHGPFARQRAGAAFGEGAVATLLEAGEAARTRGATIRARLNRVTVRAGPAARALSECLDEQPDGEPPVIWAAAHGSPNLDRTEARALAESPTRVVTSSKGCLGRLVSTAGLVDLCLASAYLASGRVPPIALLDEIDPDLPKLDLVRREPRAIAAGRAQVIGLAHFYGDGAAVATIEGSES